MGKKQVLRWFDDDDVATFMQMFVITACEQGHNPATIGEYLALAIDALIDARMEREEPE